MSQDSMNDFYKELEKQRLEDRQRWEDVFEEPVDEFIRGFANEPLTPETFKKAFDYVDSQLTGRQKFKLLLFYIFKLSSKGKI